MFSSSHTFQEKWTGRLENLKKRFPDINEEVIKSALIKYRGHAGHVAKALTPTSETPKKKSAKAFFHPAEISGKFVFSSTQSSEDTSFAERLKSLREKLGTPDFKLELGNSKARWKFTVYNDNNSLEKELEIERTYFGRDYTTFYACEMNDVRLVSLYLEKLLIYLTHHTPHSFVLQQHQVLNATPIRTIPPLKPWEKYKTELEKLTRMFRGARGQMAMWDKGKVEGFGFGSVRYEATMRSKRIVVEWDLYT
jgi:hypothetical protein